jgi:integral membrane protein
VNNPQLESSAKTLGFGKFETALRCYRIMAFVTGTVLLIGTIGLIAQHVRSLGISASEVGPLWLAHGYFFIVYVLTTVNLGLHLRWHPVRVILTALAGTVPTMSFVAERVVYKNLKNRSAL